jgi:adenine deaminase
MRIIGRLVDIVEQKIKPVEIIVEEGKILSITPITDLHSVTDSNPATNSNPVPGNSAAATAAVTANATADATAAAAADASFPMPYILPGFVDAHVHIESSLLIPSEFARLAVVHGTVATVSDPHEIANVCGLPGIEFMIKNGDSVPFYFNFGAPSCVPATIFESAGATLDAAKVTTLLNDPRIKYLSEMMNFPGVLHKDPEVMEKIAAAAHAGKPVDGHAPGLRGSEAKAYIDAGISTDHECYTAEEALEKLQYGMKILIREGSAARNFDALIGLLNEWPDQMMFCSDDKHPDSLIAGHINQLCARAVAKGIDVFKVLKAACINPHQHYKLEHGLVRSGDPADLIVVEDLTSFRVLQTFIKGQLVAGNGQTHIASSHVPSAAPAPTDSGALLTANPINNFKATMRPVSDLAYPLDKWGEQENVEQVYVIEALDGQLITNRLLVPVADCIVRDGQLHSNPLKDILKIIVVNRYTQAPVAKSFIRNFGLQRGAIASSVSHDSHNIVAVGVDDESICRAINMIIEQKGGLSCVDPGASAAPAPAFTPVSDITGEPIVAATAERELILPLPVAGLMSLGDGYHVAEAYTAIDHMAKEMGTKLGAPFMTLSFMSLLVIPHLKLSDMGLFDGDKFKLI